MVCLCGFEYGLSLPKLISRLSSWSVALEMGPSGRCSAHRAAESSWILEHLAPENRLHPLSLLPWVETVKGPERKPSGGLMPPSWTLELWTRWISTLYQSRSHEHSLTEAQKRLSYHHRQFHFVLKYFYGVQWEELVNINFIWKNIHWPQHFSRNLGQSTLRIRFEAETQPYYGEGSLPIPICWFISLKGCHYSAYELSGSQLSKNIEKPSTYLVFSRGCQPGYTLLLLPTPNILLSTSIAQMHM